MQLTRIPPLCAASQLDGFSGKTALLVDPNPRRLETGRRLLSGSARSVRAARTPCDVFGLQPEDDPQVVILSDALGSFQLLAVAEYARHRWPRAGILVAGGPGSSQAGPTAEIRLHDACMTAPLSTAGLAAATQRSAPRWH